MSDDRRPPPVPDCFVCESRPGDVAQFALRLNGHVVATALCVECYSPEVLDQAIHSMIEHAMEAPAE